MVTKKSAKFETSLTKLEKAVRALDEGGLDLEKSVDIFADGMKHAAVCQDLLEKAESKVKIAIKDFGGKERLDNFIENEIMGDD